MSDDQDKALELAIAHLDKQFGKGSVVRLGTQEFEPWPAVSTGALTLDMALGIGGLPLGRVVECFGPEGSGKSTVCLSVVAHAQQMGLRCAYVDAEHALDPAYMQALGVNLDELLISQPSYGEEAFEIVDNLIGTGAVGVIIVDSVANLTPKAELEAGMEANHMGLLPRMMAQGLRKITAKAAKNKVLVVFVNQIREKVGVVYGNPETTPGGRALKFYASVRLDLRKKEDIKSKADGIVIGSKIRAKVVKNKLGPPVRTAEFDILYGQGVDRNGCLADLSIESGVLVRAGSWVAWADTGETIVQGRDRLVEKIATEPEFADLLRSRTLG